MRMFVFLLVGVVGFDHGLAPFKATQKPSIAILSGIEIKVTQ